MKKQTYYSVSKLSLTPDEKKNLIAKGKLTIERQLRRVPPSTIIYGKGTKTIFDKVDYLWIVGDTDKYIKNKKNVGRRKVDYPNNTRNVWSGSNWWDCEKELNIYAIDKPIVNGTKHKLTFVVVSHVVDRLSNDDVYLAPVLKYKIKLV